MPACTNCGAAWVEERNLLSSARFSRQCRECGRAYCPECKREYMTRSDDSLLRSHARAWICYWCVRFPSTRSREELAGSVVSGQEPPGARDRDRIYKR